MNRIEQIVKQVKEARPTDMTNFDAILWDGGFIAGAKWADKSLADIIRTALDVVLSFHVNGGEADEILAELDAELRNEHNMNFL